jgi:hypothetical protein
MGSAELSRLRAVCEQIELCLERKASGPELARLYQEAYALAPPDEDLWINLDPKGRAADRKTP